MDPPPDEPRFPADQLEREEELACAYFPAGGSAKNKLERRIALLAARHVLNRRADFGLPPGAVPLVKTIHFLADGKARIIFAPQEVQSKTQEDEEKRPPSRIPMIGTEIIMVVDPTAEEAISAQGHWLEPAAEFMLVDRALLQSQARKILEDILRPGENILGQGRLVLLRGKILAWEFQVMGDDRLSTRLGGGFHYFYIDAAKGNPVRVDVQKEGARHVLFDFLDDLHLGQPEP
ncbi:MAG: hypothetical protein HY921_05490 [Elusimicrobia bacterium]|nr:hypothetical protein [Elusimicrobiota bacterium]